MTSWRTDAAANIRWALDYVADRYRGRRGDAGRVDLTARTPIASTVPEPHGKPGGPGAFRIKGAGMPPYIEHVAGELMKKGRSKSQAYQMAIGIVRNWARGSNGHGGKVSADVQAAAVKAIAQYDALRARAKATPNKGGSRSNTLAATQGARVELANPDPGGTSGMIALFLPPDAAAQIAVPGGLDASELHVTLAYLGDAPDKALQVRALRSVASAARFGKSLTGSLGGLGQFPAGPDGTPVWVPVDIPGLDMLRARIMADLCGDGDEVPGPYTLPGGGQQGGDVHGFTPHVTLTYLQDSGEAPPDPVPSTNVTFGEIALVIGGRRVTLPLGEPDGEDPILLTRGTTRAAAARPRVELATNQEGRIMRATATRPPATVATKALTPVTTDDVAAIRAMTKRIMKAKPGTPAPAAAKMAARAVRKRKTRKKPARRIAARTAPAGGAVTSMTRPGGIQVDLAAGPGQRYRHGWIPITPTAGKSKTRKPPASAGAPSGSRDEALAAAKDAIAGGRHAEAVNHLTRAMNAASTPGEKKQIKATRDKLAAKVMGKKPAAATPKTGAGRAPAGKTTTLAADRPRAVDLAAAPKLGSGARFKALVAKLIARGYTEEQARRIAAKIGQRKYGAKKMGQLAAHGTKAAGESATNMAAPDGGAVELASGTITGTVTASTTAAEKPSSKTQQTPKQRQAGGSSGSSGWDANKHPRAKAGSSSGGQFVPLSYNASKNSGTGYHHKGGGPRVKKVQAKLNALGFTDKNGRKLDVDGMYGPLTTSAIRKFQAAHGIKVTGVVDQTTMRAVLAAKPTTGTVKATKTAVKKSKGGAITPARTSTPAKSTATMPAATGSGASLRRPAGMTLNLAAVDGHHVPGTSYEWRHGYEPLSERTAIRYRKKWRGGPHPKGDGGDAKTKPAAAGEAGKAGSPKKKTGAEAPKLLRVNTLSGNRVDRHDVFAANLPDRVREGLKRKDSKTTFHPAAPSDLPDDMPAPARKLFHAAANAGWRAEASRGTRSDGTPTHTVSVHREGDKPRTFTWFGGRLHTYNQPTSLRKMHETISSKDRAGAPTVKGPGAEEPKVNAPRPVSHTAKTPKVEARRPEPQASKATPSENFAKRREESQQREKEIGARVDDAIRYHDEDTLREMLHEPGIFRTHWEDRIAAALSDLSKMTVREQRQQLKTRYETALRNGDATTLSKIAAAAEKFNPTLAARIRKEAADLRKKKPGAVKTKGAA